MSSHPINIDDQNLQVLSDILNINDRAISNFVYSRYFRNRLTYDSGMIKLSHKIEQSGGAPRQVIIQVDENDYVFRINEVVGKSVDANGQKFADMEIYFLSLIEDDDPVNCCYLVVDPENQTGAINGLTRSHRCIGIPESDSLYSVLSSGENQGGILLKALIKYCRAHRKRLGITKLELDDIARRQCSETDGSFLISISNMLQGRVPYYMKFGFNPVNPKALEKIKFNLAYIKTKRLEGKDIINYLESRGEDISDSIKRYFLEHDGEPVTTCHDYLMKNHCLEYSIWVDLLFSYYSLRPFNYREKLYELYL